MSLSKGPYENHYYSLGEPIRNIVKQGQELLWQCRVCLTKRTFWHDWVRRCGHYTGNPGYLVMEYPMTLPKSLGELCIEIVEEKLLAYKVHGKITDLIKEHIERVGVFGIKITKWFPRSELDTLREHLYHKRTQ